MVTPVDAITNSIEKYVIRPSNAFGLGGFVFDVEGDTTVNLRAEITDHYLEDNTTIQDHIAVKPKKVTLKSYVGELIYEAESDEVINVERAVRKLTVLNEYLPELTATAQAIKDISFDDLTSIGDSFENITSQTVNKATDYYSFVRNLINSDSKQQEAYLYLKALMENKILVSLQTPFEYMNNMAIETIVAFQGENDKFISDFTVTLKEIRTVEILNESNAQETQQGSTNKDQGRSSLQTSDVESLGGINGEESIRSDEDFLTNQGIEGNYIDPLNLPDGITQEDIDAERALTNNSDQPVMKIWEAGIVTNVSDE